MNWLALLMSTWIGSMLGLFLAFAINAVLIQVSINAFFTVYFGVLFISMGVGLLYRIN